MSIHTEAYLAELSQRHQTFHDADEKEKASLAKSVLEAVVKSDWDTVDNWVGESMKTQKISSADGVYESACALEVLLLGSVLKEFLTNVAKSSESDDDDDDNDDDSKWPKRQVGGSEIHGPVPLGPSTPGTVEVHTNQTEYSSCTDFRAYEESCPEGSVSLVLGAGNQNFLTIMDALDRVFMYNECVLIKHHPLRPYLIKPYQRILQPLKIITQIVNF